MPDHSEVTVRLLQQIAADVGLVSIYLYHIAKNNPSPTGPRLPPPTME